MSKQTHTAAPWDVSVKYSTDHQPLYMIAGDQIHDPHAGFDARDQHEARAALIAAAPVTKQERDELLIVLERYMAGHPCSDKAGTSCPTLIRARALLARIKPT